MNFKYFQVLEQKFFGACLDFNKSAKNYNLISNAFFTDRFSANLKV